ncbi:transposase [Apiospora phragmitis]|uniref:Transposase n=1 Tax=Apiospora phragmitis TaxID=2905665 RepID=A0ABR1VDH4_9PEZI
MGRKLDESALQRAIQDVINGSSMKQAAEKHNVPGTTLRARIHGRKTIKQRNESFQALTTAEESQIVTWCLVQYDLGCSPAHVIFRMFAQRILQANGINIILGKHWVERFIARHPSIGAALSKRMDFLRLNATSAEKIIEFFERLNNPILESIPPEFRFNVDEIGNQLGCGTNMMVIGPAGMKRILVADSPNREWASAVECNNALGRALPPLIIFKGQWVQQQWFPEEEDSLTDAMEDWVFAASPKGWTNKELALVWLNEVFIPHTKPENEDQWRLIILDGHASHASEDFIMTCLKHKIWLLFLPAHSSHLLQPLDLGPFSVLKDTYHRKVTLHCMGLNNMNMSKRDFLRCYEPARRFAFRPHIITGGWAATGIFPRDINKPLNSRNRRMEDQAEAGPSEPPPDVSDEQFSSTALPTPTTSRQIKELADTLGGDDAIFDGATRRVLFRKLQKRFCIDF